MTDDLIKATEQTLRQTEDTEDEASRPVTSRAMVRALVEGIPTDTNTPATWLDLEPTVGQERTEAQSDGFRYDYNDNL